MSLWPTTNTLLVAVLTEISESIRRQTSFIFTLLVVTSTEELESMDRQTSALIRKSFPDMTNKATFDFVHVILLIKI